MFKGSLHAEVLLSPEGIQRVELSIGKGTKEGLQWQIVGNGSTRLRREVEQWLEAYAAGGVSPTIPEVCLDAFSPFTQRVWVALQEIPFGQAVTYSSLAQQLGSPRASRAVGSACGRNPAPLFIPCHRVLAVGGKLGGFSCGLEIKRMLLAHERLPLS